MASFYAELTVAGNTYPVRTCDYAFTQATGARGRVAAKVRHGLVQLRLDVPDDDFLLAWAAAPHKPLAGHVTFFETNGRAARETLSFAAGHCVGYHEQFSSGEAGAGAYVCQLTIAAAKLTLSPGGGGGPFVAPAPREYAYMAPVVAEALPAAVLSKQQRYDQRMNLMSQAQGQLASAPNAAAQAALSRLGLDNVAVERAKLSEHVYHILEKPPVPEPEGWHMLTPDELAQVGVSPEMLINDKSGFKAAIYESSFERPPKLVIAYAGTEDKKDWIADGKQGLGLEEKQYNLAMDLAKAVAAEIDPTKMETTGHSLGGGLAAAGCVVTGAKSYTFNAAGLHTNTVGRAPYNISPQQMLDKTDLIDAYRSTSDPLNNTQNFFSQGPDARAIPRALGIDHPLRPAPQWRHPLSELNPLRPKKAAKALLTRALDGHGVSPQLVDHIEHRKDQDTATLTKYLAL